MDARFSCQISVGSKQGTPKYLTKLYIGYILSNFAMAKGNQFSISPYCSDQDDHSTEESYGSPEVDDHLYLSALTSAQLRALEPVPSGRDGNRTARIAY